MKTAIKFFSLGALLLGVAAIATAQGTPWGLAQKAKLASKLPELSYFNGQVGVEFTLTNKGSTIIGNRELRVTDLNPLLPKLGGGVTDDRPPLSGTAELNGFIFNLVPQLDGTLRVTIPYSAIQWFSGNFLVVRVYDGMPDWSGAPTGQFLTEWGTMTGSLL